LIERRRSLQSRLRDWALLFAPALLLLALDQISKILVRQNLAVGEAWAPIPALSKIFTVTHVQNTGVAFGQMPGLGWLFMLVNLAVLIGILVYYPRLPTGYGLVRLAFAFVLSPTLWISRSGLSGMWLTSAS
jgi:signal peptidase II